MILRRSSTLSQTKYPYKREETLGLASRDPQVRNPAGSLNLPCRLRLMTSWSKTAALTKGVRKWESGKKPAHKTGAKVFCERAP